MVFKMVGWEDGWKELMVGWLEGWKVFKMVGRMEGI